MQKSFRKLACVALLVTTSNAVLATDKMGIKVGMGFDQGFGVTAQFQDNINVFLGNEGVSADYILKRGAFSPDIPFNWYVGVGGAINWDNSDNYWDNNGYWHEDDYNKYSARVPLGLDLTFAKDWNVYAQLAPNLEYSAKSRDSDTKFGVDFALGLRYAF